MWRDLGKDEIQEHSWTTSGGLHKIYLMFHWLVLPCIALYYLVSTNGTQYCTALYMNILHRFVQCWTVYSTLGKAAHSVESMSGDISGQEDKHLQPHKYALLCPQIGETYKIHNSETYIQKTLIQVKHTKYTTLKILKQVKHVNSHRQSVFPFIIITFA